MAGIKLSAQTGEITTGTSAKTLLRIKAPSNQRLVVKEIAVSFKGIVTSDAPILVRVLRQTTDGTFTSLTPVKLDGGVGETIQSTAGHTSTSEPTAGDVVMSEEVHPQTGFVWQAPWGNEIVIAGGGRLGIEVTAGASTSAVARIVYEE